MKFTKEDAVEKLNAALTNGGKKTLRLSQRTLESQVETLIGLLTTDETELEDFAQKVLPMFETLNSNAEHDQSEFVKSYEAKRPIVIPEPTTDKQDAQKQDADDALQALLDRLSALEKAEAERASRANADMKREELVRFLEGKEVKDKEWIGKMLNLSPIGAEDDVETRGNALVEIYNLSHTASDVPSPLNPTPGNADEGDTFAGVKAIRRNRIQTDA